MSMSSWMRRTLGLEDESSTSGPPKERRRLLREDGSPYELALYKYDSCPYCRRVLRVIDQLGLEVEYRDTMRDRAHSRSLRETTGRTTVPCLFIDGEPMFESMDIIRWLEKKAA